MKLRKMPDTIILEIPMNPSTYSGANLPPVPVNLPREGVIDDLSWAFVI